MEMNDIYYLVLEFASSKEGIIAASIFVYCCWFFVPAIHAAYFTENVFGSRIGNSIMNTFAFIVLFLLVPPLLILGTIVNFFSMEAVE